MNDLPPGPHVEVARPPVLLFGDVMDRIVEIEDDSIDAIVTDPPYPEVDRPYGRMTEAEWDWMMRCLIPEFRRVLKPSGSAVIILQPNSRKVGSMRSWLWDFMSWTSQEWNIVQDAWWWNYAILPSGGATTAGLMRGSLKACVWLGSPDCYRDQSAVLWSESEGNASQRAAGRFSRATLPSGQSVDYKRCREAVVARGGVTPFNVLPATHGGEIKAGPAGIDKHPGSTPFGVANWWTRYISPPCGRVLDPFLGHGTMGLAALKLGRSFVGIERDPGYFAIAERRIAAARAETPLFTGVPA